MKKKILPCFLTVLFLAGCASEKASIVNPAENVYQPPDSEVSESVEIFYHPERFTDEQKAYITSWWGEGWENLAPTDGMVERALLGTGIEAGHKTAGIALGFSYKGNKNDIPESGGNKKTGPDEIENWVKEGRDFRLEEIAPYQHTIEWSEKVEPEIQHPADCDEKFFREASGFRILLPVDYSAHPCEMLIRGGVTEDRIVITAMLVTFGDGEDRCGVPVYHNMNFIRTVFGDKEGSLGHVVADVMAGSADTEGCYLIFRNNTEEDYTVPEKALVDGKIPVDIKGINGEAMDGSQEMPAGVSQMELYAEWKSLERGEHELTVEITETSGSKKQLTVPFVY